jgi:hypothetical protein
LIQTNELKQLSEYVEDVVSVLNNSAGLPSRLQKLCVLTIRQHMCFRTDDDFDKLHLPTQVKSLVKFENVAHELQQVLIESKQ